jgi:bifunctional DNase/RNase
MRHGRALTVAAVLGAGLLAAGTGSRAAGPGPAGPPEGTQEAEVAGVVVDPDTRQAVVVLEGKRDRRRILMSVGPFEANSIAMTLRGVRPPRPLTHDLMLTVLDGLAATLREVVVTDLRDDVYYARLHLEGRGGPLQVDSRPSDAIALALRARVPIRVADRVFDRAGRAVPPRPDGGRSL